MCRIRFYWSQSRNLPQFRGLFNFFFVKSIFERKIDILRVKCTKNKPDLLPKMNIYFRLREIAGWRPIKSYSPQNLASSDIGIRLTWVCRENLSSILVSEDVQNFSD